MLKTQLILLTMLFASLPFSFLRFNIYKTQPTVQLTRSIEAPLFSEASYPDEARKYSTNYRIKKVVIDPGHGGYDSGCSGSHSTEKHIALSVAQKMKAYMEAQHPDVQIILTRNSDVFVPLHRRAAIANEIQADLFISVHCNSIRNASKIHGSETYVLGAHKLKENLDVAKRENAVVLFEEDYAKQYNFDPNTDAGHITMSLYQNAYLEQSLLFAEKVENNVRAHTALRSRGVKQAGFLVLRETTMPSVLIETGYLTNAKDQAYLQSEEGQNRMAGVVARAFSEYRNIMETGDGTSAISAPALPPAPKHKTGGSPYQRAKTGKQPNSSSVIIAPQTSPASAPVAAVENANPVRYRVQLAASENAVDLSVGRWRNIAEYEIQIIPEGGMLKYQAGDFFDFTAANAARRDLSVRGFKGAWVVAYRNGVKIGLTEAKSITEN